MRNEGKDLDRMGNKWTLHGKLPGSPGDFPKVSSGQGKGKVDF